MAKSSIKWTMFHRHVNYHIVPSIFWFEQWSPRRSLWLSEACFLMIATWVAWRGSGGTVPNKMTVKSSRVSPWWLWFTSSGPWRVLHKIHQHTMQAETIVAQNTGITKWYKTPRWIHVWLWHNFPIFWLPSSGSLPRRSSTWIGTIPASCSWAQDGSWWFDGMHIMEGSGIYPTTWGFNHGFRWDVEEFHEQHGDQTSFQPVLASKMQSLPKNRKIPKMQCILWGSCGDFWGDFMRILRSRYGIPDVRFMDDDQLCYFYSSDTR